jgi:hypothetical protein
MSFITLLSSIAIVVGLVSGLPQLATMARTRSAAGQSAVGWLLGAFVNTMMAYVNFAGYHAAALSAGNVLSVGICATAVSLVLRFGADAGAEPAADTRGVPALTLAAPGGQVSDIPVSDLATHEFWALRDHFEHEARRRSERELELVAA